MGFFGKETNPRKMGWGNAFPHISYSSDGRTVLNTYMGLSKREVMMTHMIASLAASPVIRTPQEIAEKANEIVEAALALMAKIE